MYYHSYWCLPFDGVRANLIANTRALVSTSGARYILVKHPHSVGNPKLLWREIKLKINCFLTSSYCPVVPRFLAKVHFFRD